MMRNNMCKSLLVIISVLLSINCFADCTDVSLIGSVNLKATAATVPVGTAIGTVIEDVVVTPTVGKANGCTGQSFARYSTGEDTQTKYLGNNEIYSTNVPGIGFALCFEDCAGNGGAWYPFVTDSHSTSQPLVDFRFPWHLVLIVTGPVKSGFLASGVYGSVGVGATSVISVNVIGAAINATACSLKSSNIQVPIGDVSTDKFTGIGSTSGSKSFDVGLTCDNETNLSVLLDGIQNNDTSDKSVLALTDDSTGGNAAGIGVQISYNGSPLNIGSLVPLGHTTGNVNETYQFSANYYQTRNSISAGNANTTASLDIIYQ